ncbi:PP2C family protein-serine/threonine phosphatase [Gimesia aquarii]|uniref:Serine/threonine phosphatase stp n=1 Tax=Gimesia aquarii TaxID=2527964 RepID=A0A517WX50_9PLAN|nr:protein phosphatase 2C domain-containing protein [Gimesia aquarii]QDU09824.1 Serine/threonine phosphatase stp [Gimesia aquarii]
MAGKMDCFGLSHIGSKQSLNQDQFLIADLEKAMRIHSSSLGLDDHSRMFGNSQGKLLLVADGMGRDAAGDQASRIATESITRYVLNTMPWFLRLDEQSDDDLHDELVEALQRCEKRVEIDVQQHPEREGMGTTLTMAYLIWPRLYLVHAGNSRCYLFRQSKLKQITKDHSLAEELVFSGVLEVDEVPEIWENTLVNLIGGHDDSDLNPDVHKARLQIGDTLLLCTDGLTKYVSDFKISEILSQNASADETCTRLVNQAKDDGGSDNITVIVARFLDSGDQDVAISETIDTETGCSVEQTKTKTF